MNVAFSFSFWQSVKVANKSITPASSSLWWTLEQIAEIWRQTPGHQLSFNKKKNKTSWQFFLKKGLKLKNDIIFKEVMAIVSTSQRHRVCCGFRGKFGVCWGSWMVTWLGLWEATKDLSSFEGGVAGPRRSWGVSRSELKSCLQPRDDID